MDVRKGEQGKHWFRSDRFTMINGQWFFQTREGSFEGPFDTLDEARMELLLFLRHADDVLYSAG
ncbi:MULTISPECIES: DUF6316 family protein [Marinobacter]|uniref:DUF6316 domain-containing protein n=1 Tax=Marinobacter profundi TaxID=2666256 RepID=A0A2G1UJN1_9GAMM|nr:MULTISPECIES: DUF6316 family protein [Marinobacter]MBD3656559.1 hypothetical protein [Marinobacter sp.]PHQ14640.1 hypothetical protein CLH61_12825 [Marinobacter profundi]